MDLDEKPDRRQSWRGDAAATAWLAFLTRYARRHLGFLAGLVIVGAALGIGYRYRFDPLEKRVPSFFLRSALHGIGLAIVGWSVHLSLAAPPKRWRDRLRQWPQISELAIKALIMTAVLTIVTIGLQLLLYPEPFSRSWLIDSLPLIVGIAFCVSLVAGGISSFSG
jgi:adenylate cyclase